MTKTKFPNKAAEFVALTHYCRWLPVENRRENWREVVDRVIEFLSANTERADAIPRKVWEEIESTMLSFRVMPSMRLVATAGPVAERDNSCLYNCSFSPIRDWRAYSEMMFLLMSGVGVGFSVERENTKHLPEIKPASGTFRDEYIVEDSREGWAKAVLFALETYSAGEDVVFDYSQIRPYGTPLKSMGGRASGPDPLKKLIKSIRRTMTEAAGRKLTSLEAHDIACFIAEAAVMGGKRRSAMISFSDVDDQLMRDSKDFRRGPVPVHRYAANNTAVYHTKPDSAEFLLEWAALANSGSGERGILNLGAMGKHLAPARNWTGQERVNPCGEAILKPYGLCNLTEVIVRADDDISDLVEGVRTATWLGVMQSTFTHFPFLRKEWRKNCEEERLIGVSLTGQLDNPDILTPQVLKQLKRVVERTAKHAAKKLGINPPVAYTLVKPSGTVSQLVDCAPGVHPRWSKYYIRRYRIATTDPVYHAMLAQGVKFKPEVGQSVDNMTTAVFEYPVESPDGAVTRENWTAIDQLEWYLKVQKNWSTHNVSNTVYVKPDEWLMVGEWVYKNWDGIVGISFFPHDGGRYELAPYESIDEETYKKMVAEFPAVDFGKLGDYEKETGDTTSVAQEFACSAGKCDVV
jgi:ribonucleoside-triphosphate reductase